VIIVEGEKKVDAARLLFPDHVAVSPMNGARSPHKTDWAPLAQRAVVIWPDHDAPGLAFGAAVSELTAVASAASVAIIEAPPHWPEGWDLADELPNGVTHEVLAEMLVSTKPRIPSATSSGNGLDREAPPKRRLTALTAGELLTMEIPEREMLLAPVLPGKGLVMIYSKRGVGKTFAALFIAYAVASGGTYLRWVASKPHRVLVIDGEMPLIALKQRLASIAFSSAAEPPSSDYIRIIAADYQENGIPDLATAEGVRAIEEHIADGVDLVIIDNLSTLCRAGKENEGDSWVPIQEWALDLRRRGISVLFVHHAGKGGAQRGTSKREDVLDTVIVLRHPDDYSPPDGARFEVHLEKARGVQGDQAKPFEARLEIRDDLMTWTTRDLESVEARRAADLKAEGFSVRDIGAEMGISKSKADRLLKKAREMGLADE
jgi:putative DNA primase/helicase